MQAVYHPWLAFYLLGRFLRFKNHVLESSDRMGRIYWRAKPVSIYFFSNELIFWDNPKAYSHESMKKEGNWTSFALQLLQTPTEVNLPFILRLSKRPQWMRMYTDKCIRVCVIVFWQGGRCATTFEINATRKSLYWTPARKLYVFDSLGGDNFSFFKLMSLILL